MSPVFNPARARSREPVFFCPSVSHRVRIGNRWRRSYYQSICRRLYLRRHRQCEFQRGRRVPHRLPEGSGARLNCAKSEGLWVGPWTARKDTSFGIVWHTDSIKCFSVWIGSSSNVCSRNWIDATAKFDRVLQLWSGRALSFAGRSTVIKSFAAANLWHVAHVVPPPPGVVADIVRKRWLFIWHNMRTYYVVPCARFPLPLMGWVESILIWRMPVCTFSGWGGCPLTTLPSGASSRSSG